MRSILFVPGADEDKISKMMDRGADMVIVDLEDAVALKDKEDARDFTRTISYEADGFRINHPSTYDGLKDILELSQKPSMHVKYVCIPKVESAGEVEVVAAHFPNSQLLVCIETPTGLTRIDEILSARRVAGVFFGGMDYVCAINGDLSSEMAYVALQYPKNRIVQAAHTAGVYAFDMPFLTITVDKFDLNKSVALGFDGRAVMHPDQISAVNDAFSRIARDEKILAASLEHEEPIFNLDGAMIGPPHVERAKRNLSRV